MTDLIREYTHPMLFTEYGQLLWTKGENQRLMNSYRKISKENIMILFPDRTWNAIKKRACKLKISKKRIIWTKRENMWLFNNYKKIPREEIMKLFPTRTWCAILGKATKLKISRKGRPFTPEEDALLVKLYYERKLTYDKMSPLFTLRDGRSLRARMYLLKKREKEAEK